MKNLFPSKTHRILGWCVFGVFVTLYGAFEASDIGSTLYKWTKEWGPYEVRQYLGMSKRFLWQYVHLILQCGILFLLPILLTGPVDRSGWVERGVRLSLKYWLPVFLFHYPALFFVAALIDHDAASWGSRALLFAGTLGLSILCGWACFKLAAPIAAIGKAIGPKVQKVPPSPVPVFPVSGQFSRALDFLKLLAAACVVLGHFSYEEFTDQAIGVFDGAAPRFTIPLFFCISGYLLAHSVHRSALSAGTEFFKRYWGTMTVVLPAMVIVPLMDQVGFAADARIYTMVDDYMVGGHLGLSGPLYFAGSLALGLSFMAESLWVTLLIDNYPMGGVGVFNNAPFWFLCYIIPYQLAYVAWVKLRGIPRISVLVGLVFLTGPPIWFLAPMFVGGILVYRAHLWYRSWIEIEEDNYGERR